MESLSDAWVGFVQRLWVLEIPWKFAWLGSTSAFARNSNHRTRESSIFAPLHVRQALILQRFFHETNKLTVTRDYESVGICGCREIFAMSTVLYFVTDILLACNLFQGSRA